MTDEHHHGHGRPGRHGQGRPEHAHRHPPEAGKRSAPSNLPDGGDPAGHGAASEKGAAGHGQDRAGERQHGRHWRRRHGHGGHTSRHHGGHGQGQSHGAPHGRPPERSQAPRTEPVDRGPAGEGAHGVEGGQAASGPSPRNAPTIEARGILEAFADGSGFLRQPQRSYRSASDDVFVPRDLLQRLGAGDARSNGGGLEGIEVDGLAFAAGAGGGPATRGGHRGHAPRGHGGGNSPRLGEIRTINGVTPEEFSHRRPFGQLTSIDPFEMIRLETEPAELSMRVIDLLTPIGKGQRCLIVAPPRAGKTTLLQRIAAAISRNHAEIHLVVLLVDERPEEVTDMKRSVRGEVIASSSDDVARNHVSVARIVLERARRLVEVGRDVVILLDSLTRLARAHNTATPGTGRTLSGGLDARTMEQPRRLFGAARKAEEGGSLTVIATALVDTGSRMDDVIFQEFKGTGNMELVLDRALFEQRIYPAVDIAKSGTRKEEKLFAKEDLPRIHKLRRVLFEMKPHDAMLKLLDKLGKYPSNAAFLKALDG